MGTETFSKKGKFSKHEKMKGDGMSKRLSHPGAMKNYPGAPDPLERKYDRRYRKAVLGDQQYPAEPKPAFDDIMSPMSMFGGLRGL